MLTSPHCRRAHSSPAYRRAAIRVRETPTSIAQLALDGMAKELSGIGRTIEEKIVQIVRQPTQAAFTKYLAPKSPAKMGRRNLAG